MSILVEDGSGIPGAESYASVATIDAYWLARTHLTLATTWAAATTPFKEGAAREATAYLDAVWGPYYRGVRAGYLQGLLFPRTGALDGAGYPLPEIPPELVAALCELAARALAAPLGADSSVDGAIRVYEETIGPLTERTEYALAGSSQPRYGVIEGILSPILNGSQPGAPAGGGWNWL